ncbi:MAG TPA: hypothetical protein PKL78_11080 [Anaerolineales bacterium]|nr:hypothetical protein [Anaerolineales bacterium]HNN14093.1 hypothetical protein [Anaerolineales bacterium]
MPLNQIASILALLVGGMSILAGGMVLRGWQPGWSVIPWLPIYNFVTGLLTLIPAYLLWVNHRYMMAASITIFSIHTIVLLLLLTVFRNTAAFQSIGAMSFRIITWIAILILLYFRHTK